jgi:hypothetical protein
MKRSPKFSFTIPSLPAKNASFDEEPFVLRQLLFPVCDIFAEIYLFRSPKARFGLYILKTSGSLVGNMQ